MSTRRALRMTVLALFLGTSASCSGNAGKDEQAFCDAVKAGDAATARTLMGTGGFDVWARNSRGDCQPLKVVFDNATLQRSEFTAMALELLKIQGVSRATWLIPNSGRGGTSGTGSPLISAAGNGNVPLVRAILAAGVDIRDTQGRAALLDAVFKGPSESVRAMIEAGADPNGMLGTAILTRKHDLIAYAESKGAREDRPALLVAARQGDLVALDAAIAQKANLEVEDGQGLTPVMRAAVFDHPEAIARLAKAGANVNHMTDGNDYDQGMTALHLAAALGSAPTINALLAAHADIEARENEGWPTPLLWAVMQGSSAGVHELVAAGAKGHIFKAGDKPALAYAVQQGRLSMVRDLLKAGGRPNERIGEGWTPPLHVALTHCGTLEDGSGNDSDFHVDLLRALVDAGADRSAKDAAGLTPAEAAAKRLADATHPYYKHCFQAKVDYLQSLR
ncbi:MAG: ankyrin repeat domain-containing protein [Acidobacteriota bacterium]